MRMILLFVLPIFLAADNLQVVKDAGGYNFVDISIDDISRIYCEDTDISGAVYSKEKDIHIDRDGQNSYVKIMKNIKKINGEVVDVKVNKDPREVFIDCNNKTYSLIMVPKDIPSQTIVLKSLYDGAQKEAKKFESSEYETTILELIKSVYSEKIPKGYKVQASNETIGKYKELELIEVVKYVGHSYEAIEYKIEIKKNEVELHEKLFIDHFREVLAISLESLKSNKGDTVRMAVVRKRV